MVSWQAPAGSRKHSESPTYRYRMRGAWADVFRSDDCFSTTALFRHL